MDTNGLTHIRPDGEALLGRMISILEQEPRISHKPCGVLDDLSLSVEKSDLIQEFSPVLSWSHYLQIHALSSYRRGSPARTG